jgi:hypothetical protein
MTVSPLAISYADMIKEIGEASVDFLMNPYGYSTLGGKTKSFSQDKGVDITTLNGYELHVFGEDIWLRKWGRDVVNKDGTTKVDVQIG